MTDQFTRQYKDFEYKFNCLKEEALHILDYAFQKSHIKLNKTESRIKTLESLLDKTERKEIKDSILEIKDIVGIRLVCLFLSDIAAIKEIINREFTVIEEDDKINGKTTNEFGYMSLHYIVKMKDSYVGPRYDGIKEIFFEIQVRTMAMDAWANISHYLDYKTENDIPEELKRDFYALSGLFYVADKHFEMFYKSRESNIEQIVESIEVDKNYHQSINIDSLTAYLQTKFPDREHGSANIISVLVNELITAGYEKLDQLDEALDRAYSTFLLYEKEYPPYSEDGGQYANIGVVRISLALADEKFYQLRRGTVSSSSIAKYREMIS
jgi:putative GTP pyrophosphokinase